jgi:AcrR family transcriptional regulator
MPKPSGQDLVQSAVVLDEATIGHPGEHTRQTLIRAAVVVIAEHGWGGLTTRVAATQAGVNPALVHYHFGSVPALARAAAAHAIDVVCVPAIEQLLGADDVLSGLDAAVRMTIESDTDAPEPRVIVEALVGALHDPELAVQMRDAIERFRTALARRLADVGSTGPVTAIRDPAASATLLAALLDGIALHHLLDPARDLSGASVALRALLEPGGSR